MDQVSKTLTYLSQNPCAPGLLLLSMPPARNPAAVLTHEVQGPAAADHVPTPASKAHACHAMSCCVCDCESVTRKPGALVMHANLPHIRAQRAVAFSWRLDGTGTYVHTCTTNQANASPTLQLWLLAGSPWQRCDTNSATLVNNTVLL